MFKRPVCSLVLLAALMLSACGFGAEPEPAADTGDASGSPPAETTGNVTITFGAPGFMRYAYEPLIAAFNQQHPGITVQFVALDEVYRGGNDENERTRQIVSLADTAETGAKGGQFPLGLLYDLKPLMDADPNFNPDDYYPGALNGATSSDGAIYQLPQMLNVQLLFYNKDLWAAAGLAAPTPDWTWQDLEAAAGQLVQKQGDTITVYGLADDDTFLTVLLAELKDAGLDLTTAPPSSAQVDRPEVAAALERVAGRFRSGAFYVPPEGMNARDTIIQLILDQQVAMWGSTIAGDLSSPQKQNGGSAASFTVGVALHPPLPNGARDSANGYVMSSGTQHPNEAWAWLSFLSRQLITDQFNPEVSISSLPARRSLAEQSGYWSRLDDEAAAVVQAALARPAPAPSAANDLEAYAPLIQAVFDITGGKAAAQAASEAQAAISNQVAQSLLTPTSAPDAAPIVVATPVPNVAPPGATAITFGVPMPKGSDQASRLAQQFNESNQGVFVQLKDTFTGTDFMSTPDTAGQTDCFASLSAPAQAEFTATLDLQPLIDTDSGFQLDDYPAALLAPYRQDGRLHGLPWGMNPRMVVYNQDLFNAAGLQPPTAEWTVDDFLNAAQQLTAGQGDTRQYGFVVPRQPSEGVKFLVHLLGAATAQGSGDTLKPNFTDPNVVQAATRVIDLLKNETPHTRLDDFSTGQPTDFDPLVGEGRIGMWFAWGMYAYGQQDPSFTLGMVVPPLAQATLDGDDIPTTGLYISAGTDKQQACWTWLKFLSGTTSLFANLPARRSAAHSEALNQAQPGMATAYDAYTAAIDRAGQLAAGAPETPIDYYWFYQAIDGALQGKNVEQELAVAQTLTEQHLACVRGGGEHLSCVQQVDPSYQG